jgi:hypothetical protein
MAGAIGVEAACRELLPAAAKEALESVRRDTQRGLEVLFAALPRRCGRAAVGSGLRHIGAGTCDLRAVRACDLGAAELLSEAPAERIERLYGAGDFEERRMIVKALALLPVAPVTLSLLETAHRTNDMFIFESAFADSDLAARALADDMLNRVVLKCAFNDVELARLIGIQKRANAELSTMLLGFMSEREAAGRPIWAGSLELAAYAPAAGVEARILGDLWHGQDARRLAAARAAGAWPAPRIREEVRARQALERHPPVQAALRAAAESAG